MEPTREDLRDRLFDRSETAGGILVKRFWKYLRWPILFFIATLFFIILIGMGARKAVRESFRREVRASLANGKQPELVSLDELPEVVRRSLRFSGADRMDGFPAVYLEESGFFRMKPGAEAFPLRAVQYFTTNPPALHWLGEVSMAGVPLVSARDLYQNGDASMHVRLFSLFTLADEKGPDMNEATLLRYLAETMWFPYIMRDRRITWKPAGKDVADATIHERGIAVTARFFFQDSGAVDRVEAERLWNDGKSKGRMPWGGRVLEYGERGGLRIPVHVQVYWTLESGEYIYVDMNIDRAYFFEKEIPDPHGTLKNSRLPLRC